MKRLGLAHQRGTALLLAMMVLTLIATLASAMVWQQWRAIQVEAAERARMQSAWILSGALDWARLILREDARTGGSDHLGEPWAVPLAEARLSTFLAADRESRNADEGPEAFLSGLIVDAQARYNLRNAIDGDKVIPSQMKVLESLCASAGVPSDVASRLAEALRDASQGQREQAPLQPQTLSQLRWAGLEPAALERLASVMVLLPRRTTVNVNTAAPEVLRAVVPGMDAGTAQRIVELRQRSPFRSVEEVRPQIPAPPGPDAKPVDLSGLGTSTDFFEVRGRLRLEERVLEDRSLLERRRLDLVVLLRERVNSLSPGR